MLGRRRFTHTTHLAHFLVGLMEDVAVVISCPRMPALMAVVSDIAKVGFTIGADSAFVVGYGGEAGGEATIWTPAALK